MSRIILLGLPEDLANQISDLLLEDSHQVSRECLIHHVEGGQAAATVFIWGDGPEYRETIRRLRQSGPRFRLVVATRLPDHRKWLDALEAGADDYCGAPFDRHQIRWVVHRETVPPA